MATLSLTKRNYLGEGYFHWFENDKTKEIVTVETTQAQYESMGLPGGSQYNPTLEGHTWLYSMPGVTKVDTPSGLLGDDEYAIRDGVAIVCSKNKGPGKEVMVAVSAIDATDQIQVDAEGYIDPAIWQ